MSYPLSQRPLDIIFYQAYKQGCAKSKQRKVGMRDRREKRNRWTERDRDRRQTGTDRDSQRRIEGDRDRQRRRERDSACSTRAEIIPTRAVPIIARAWLRHCPC